MGSSRVGSNPTRSVTFSLLLRLTENLVLYCHKKDIIRYILYSVMVNCTLFIFKFFHMVTRGVDCIESAHGAVACTLTGTTTPKIMRSLRCIVITYAAINERRNLQNYNISYTKKRTLQKWTCKSNYDVLTSALVA